MLPDTSVTYVLGTHRYWAEYGMQLTVNRIPKHQIKKPALSGFLFGGRCRGRTYDIHLVRVALCQLS